MKILLLWPMFHPIPNAAAIRGEAFARYLAERGNQVCVITPVRDSVSQPDCQGQYVVSRMRTYDTFSERHGFVASALLAPFPLMSMRREVARLRPDLIIASSPAPFLAFEGFLASRSQQIPFVYDMRDSWRLEEYTHSGALRNKAKRWIERCLCRGADMVFCVSESLRRMAISDYGLLDQKVKVVTNGAEPLELDGPAQKDYDLVFSGYPAKYRFIPELLKGIAIVSRKMPVKMLCLGWKGTPQEKELRNLIGRLGVEESVDMRPPVSHDKVAIELSKARLGVTSLSGDSSLASAVGTKTYEYLSAGLPVACLSPFAKSELQDFVESNDVGFYSRDSEEFAGKLIALLSSEGDLSRLKENARALSAKYRWKSIVYDVYEKYLKDLGGSKE
ncbi:MAG: glycosyltransferase family 4 protein [Thermoplasmata archaeon]